MWDRKRTIIISLGFMLLATAAVDAFGKTDPYLKSTRTQLQKARARLYAGENDDGGHRVKAMAFVTAAIEEVSAAMKSNNHHAAAPATEVSTVRAASSAVVGSTQVEKALGYLKQAQENLGAATPDAAGHHGRAGEYIKKAIEEVELAIAAKKSGA